MARQRRRGSHRSVPPELRLAYGSRARPLGRAILSLLPPPPPPGAPCPTCHSSVGCLACHRWAYLLREGDPIAYRRLVIRAVCVVAPAGAAPPPPRYTLGNAGHSQAKLVRETIKSIIANRSCTTRNVLCIGCREGGQSRCVNDLVSSPSWEILLNRIGDLLMCYILRHSSIFLSVKKNDYFQVSGLPLNVVLQKPIFVSAKARKQRPFFNKEECSKCYIWSEKEVAAKLSGGNCVKDSHVEFHSFDANTCKFDALQSSENYVTARIAEPNCSPEGCNFARFHSISKSTTCSSLYAQNPSKRKRLYRWQRCNKQKICCEGESSIVWRKINNSDFNGAKVSNEIHPLGPTGDTNSLTERDVNYLQTTDLQESHGVDVLSSEMSPSSVFDMRPSECLCDYITSRCKPSRPLHGPVSFLHLNS